MGNPKKAATKIKKEMRKEKVKDIERERVRVQREMKDRNNLRWWLGLVPLYIAALLVGVVWCVLALR